MAKLAFLVDDSKSARIVLSRQLKKNGFDEVAMAESGEQALEMLKQLQPDAMFVDFLMDGMDGLETISEIKKDPRFQQTPVVMCTANEGENYVRAAVEHGALGILTKPPTEKSLADIIQLIESQAPPPSPQVASTPVSPTTEPVAVSGLSADEVRALATVAAREAAQASATELAREAAESTARDAARAAVDDMLQPMVASLVERSLEGMRPPEVDTEALRNQIVSQVNQDLQEFVRQINERSVAGMIEASIYEQIQEVANDFSQRLQQLKEEILAQVPEKHEMIEHIRVVTEGTMEAQAHETATQVSRDVANSVATETVEQLLDEHLADQAMRKSSGGGSRVALWMGLLALLAGAGYALYSLKLI